LNVLPLLSEIASRGVCIRANGVHLVVSPDKLTYSLITKIQDNKPALIRSLERLRQYADGDDDWQEVVSDPAQFEAFISSVATFEQRQRGEIPAHYTATVYCQTCNKSVPHFSVGADSVKERDWCINGQPAEVTGRTP